MDNLVIQLAKKLNPGAYSDWFDGCGPDSKLIEPDARIKYLRSRAECDAIDILKWLASVHTAEIKSDLIEFEKEGWRRLDIPIDDHEFDKIISDKYATIGD